jgi:hypothetical protein
VAGAEYQSTPHMEAIWRAVCSHFKVEPQYVSADRSGGRMALGLAAAAKANAIRNGFINGIPGISKDADYSDIALLRGHIESRSGRKWHPDYVPGKVTGKTKQEAKSILSSIYDSDDHNKLWRDTYTRALKPGGNFWMNRRALNGHNDLRDLKRHAVFNDLMATLMKHEVMITLQANIKGGAKDPSIVEFIELGTQVMNHIPVELRSPDRGIEFVVGKGGVDAHTDNPVGRLGVERRGLRSVATFMRLVFSGSPDSMIVTTEDVVSEAA